MSHASFSVFLLYLFASLDVNKRSSLSFSVLSSDKECSFVVKLLRLESIASQWHGEIGR